MTDQAAGAADQIDELVDIGSRQLAGDEERSVLVKAFADSNKILGKLADGMFDLLKGGKGSDDEDDEDEDEDDSEDDDSEEYDDDDDDDDAPGFQMNKGGGGDNQYTLFGGHDADDDDRAEGPMSKGQPLEYEDGMSGIPEDFLADLAKAQVAMLDQQAANDSRFDEVLEQLAQLAKAQVHLAKMIEHLGGVQVETAQELVKSRTASPVAEAQAAAQGGPAFPASREALPPKAPIAQPKPVMPAALPKPPSPYLAGVASEREEKTLLMKAVRMGALSPVAENMYRTAGVFSQDEAEHNQIASSVVAFASTQQGA